ncbi:MAG: 3'-5' exonuclease [Gemmatimonadetes bacterium]|nr:3'-5' exonuclease [Gemmatimonadota bacterium]
MTRGRTEPSLLQHAQAALEEGPTPTGELARRVLGIRGHQGAAAAAVFALLGADDRFQVDGEGIWSIRPGTLRLGSPLSVLRYAVVDVETTGGKYERGHGITEVAIVEVEGGTIVDEYQTLVNPGRRVPTRIARLTGITDSMLLHAPVFSEVAEDVFRRLDGRVFVAHNARYDWGWLRLQLGDALGAVPETDRLCTVRLARRLLPELRRRNLDALTEFFRIPIHQRHRAYGDALATARVLLPLLDLADGMGLGDLHALQRYRPPARDRQQMDLFAEADLSPLGGPRLSPIPTGPDEV